jgi:hypothetical protein
MNRPANVASNRSRRGCYVEADANLFGGKKRPATRRWALDCPSSYSTEDPFVLAFATSISIDDRPAESWAGSVGLSPASGDFRLTTLVPEFERKVNDMAAERLATRIPCVSRFDAHDAGAR